MVKHSTNASRHSGFSSERTNLSPFTNASQKNEKEKEGKEKSAYYKQGSRWELLGKIRDFGEEELGRGLWLGKMN